MYSDVIQASERREYEAQALLFGLDLRGDSNSAGDAPLITPDAVEAMGYEVKRTRRALQIG